MCVCVCVYVYIYIGVCIYIGVSGTMCVVVSIGWGLDKLSNALPIMVQMGSMQNPPLVYTYGDINLFMLVLKSIACMFW